MMGALDLSTPTTKYTPFRNQMQRYAPSTPCTGYVLVNACNEKFNMADKW